MKKSIVHLVAIAYAVCIVVFLWCELYEVFIIISIFVNFLLLLFFEV